MGVLRIAYLQSTKPGNFRRAKLFFSLLDFTFMI